MGAHTFLIIHSHALCHENAVLSILRKNGFTTDGIDTRIIDEDTMRRMYQTRVDPDHLETFVRLQGGLDCRIISLKLDQGGDAIRRLVDLIGLCDPTASEMCFHFGEDYVLTAFYAPVSEEEEQEVGKMLQVYFYPERVYARQGRYHIVETKPENRCVIL